VRSCAVTEPPVGNHRPRPPQSSMKDGRCGEFGREAISCVTRFIVHAVAGELLPSPVRNVAHEIRVERGGRLVEELRFGSSPAPARSPRGLLGNGELRGVSRWPKLSGRPTRSEVLLERAFRMLRGILFMETARR